MDIGSEVFAPFAYDEPVSASSQYKSRQQVMA